VFRWATTSLAPLALQACERAGVELSEIAALVAHQANARIIDSLARRLNLPNAIIAKDIVESGNTSAASIPLALSKMVEKREVPSGAPVLLFGFGGVLTTPDRSSGVHNGRSGSPHRGVQHHHFRKEPKRT
jgi:3-oxoacyl-[acyl-carrier-protein] synthase-3